jgi:hypothetical protein
LPAKVCAFYKSTEKKVIRTRGIVAGLALALGLAVTTQCADADQKFLFGAYTGKTLSTQKFETMIGHSIGISKYYQLFTDLPKSQYTRDIQTGHVVYIAWTSDVGAGGTSPIATDILAGKYDAWIQQEAQAIAALGGTIMLEWQPEMTDSPRNAPFMAGVMVRQQGPTYIAVWQHLHDIFVAEGATNVQWVWSPGDDAYVTQLSGKIKCLQYFPGVAYVDWMGLHEYNKLDTPVPYYNDPNLIAFYNEAQQLAPGLPLIHGETGATSATSAQSEWLSTAASSLQSDFPLIRAFVYFNANAKAPQQGTELYTLTGQGLTTYDAMAQDAYFFQ